MDPSLIHRLSNCVTRLINLRLVNSQMSDQSNGLLANRETLHSRSIEPSQQFGGRSPSWIDFNDDQIRINTIRSDAKRIACVCCRSKLLCTLMVIGQPSAMVPEREQRSGSNDSGLAHRTAEQFHRPSSLINEPLRSGKCRSNGSP